jgi:UDP-4-amino-4,6-dideoxy-N-acetyl-beta-L-altrosamine N-acetyltransferase
LLRPLEESDLELILHWRNAPAVRQAMYSQHKISMVEHQAWYQRKKVDASAQWFLYLDQSDVPRGVVYFTAIDAQQRSAFWGFYASPEAALGTGVRMSLDALNLAFGELCLSKLSAEALTTNSRSLKMHKKVGFTEEGCFREQFFDGEKRVNVIRLGMLAGEWLSKREVLQGRVAELDARRGILHGDRLK